MHCDGAGSAVRLRLEDERDYRLVLIAKNVGTRDEFHVSNANRDTSVMLVENTDIGATMSLHGEDALKVCSKSQLLTKGCNWSCEFDEASGVAKMSTTELSAEFAVICY